MASNQKYSLRWNDFSVNVASTFRDLHSRQVNTHTLMFIFNLMFKRTLLAHYRQAITIQVNTIKNIEFKTVENLNR